MQTDRNKADISKFSFLFILFPKQRETQKQLNSIPASFFFFFFFLGNNQIKYWNEKKKKQKKKKFYKLLFLYVSCLKTEET